VLSVVLPLEKIRSATQARWPALVEFTQQIVQIPSLPGQEEQVALAVRQELERLRYDDVWIDEAGNVIGRIKGGGGPTIMLNGHLDHVDPGIAASWPHPPFSGAIVAGELWGRASVDMKGPLASMIYGASLLKMLDLTPAGDVYVTAVVMEEIGGFGTDYLTTRLKAAVAICGEPSRNILRRGHRGRIELDLTCQGRSAHASVPQLGLNPHYGVAAFLAKMPEIELAEDETLGRSSVAPTLYRTDQSSPNVIPGEGRLTLDWRNVPGESPPEVVAKLQALLERSLAGSELARQCWAKVDIHTELLTTYTGLTKQFSSIFPAFILTEDNPFIVAARASLTDLLDHDPGVDVWRFATDGGHLMAAGIPTIGFGPGDERLAHTNQERLSLAQLEEATAAYAVLILTLAEAVGGGV
jgi:succinyl-diaminopimelate desuccinylase